MNRCLCGSGGVAREVFGGWGRGETVGAVEEADIAAPEDPPGPDQDAGEESGGRSLEVGASRSTRSRGGFVCLGHGCCAPQRQRHHR